MANRYTGTGKTRKSAQAWAERNRDRLRAEAKSRYLLKVGKLTREYGSGKRLRTPKGNDLWKFYRITEFDYDFMLALCEGKCPTCQREWGWSGKRTSRPVVDHCHVTSKVRGILCGSCNIAEGHLNSPEAALELYNYMIQARINADEKTSFCA